MGNIKKYLCIIPVTVFISLFFLYGFFRGLLQSFGMYQVVGESGFTLEYYSEILGSREFLNSLVFTSKMAVISSMISFIVSVGVLFFLYMNLKNSPYKGRYIQRIIESPLLVPYLVASYLILILFMQNGFISVLLQKFGIIENYKEFPVITNDERGIGIIVTYLWKTCPFIVMMSFPVLKRIGKKWDTVAYIFGVGRVRFFFEVALPLMAPSLFMSFFIVLAYMFMAFETPYILGMTYPKALAVTAYDIYSKGNLDQRPGLMVINMFISLISVVSGVLVYVVNRFVSGEDHRGWE